MTTCNDVAAGGHHAASTRVHRTILLCADDFGMNPQVNAGIVALAELGRLSGTSVLVDAPAAGEHVNALLASGVQVGLHLNFTESFGQAGLCLPLRSFIAAAYLRKLPLAQLKNDIQRQLLRFRQITGRPPDYIDGHQHVHQLPGVRNTLLSVLRLGNAQKCGTTHRPWVRNTACPRVSGLPLRLQFKAKVIASLGAGTLRRQARAAGFSQNPGFLGVYDFNGGTAAYERWMRCWLANSHEGDVLMCHPAQQVNTRDALGAQRCAEYQVLGGAVFTRLMVEYGVGVL